MNPNCEWCQRGSHDKCTEDWCECAQNKHGVDGTVDDGPGTLDTIPLYAMLDVWQAVGFDPAHFDTHYEQSGYADTWSWLLAVVRNHAASLADVNKPKAEIERVENADPLYLRAKAALESLNEINAVTIDVTPELDVRNGYGQSVRRTLEATITITGPVS